MDQIQIADYLAKKVFNGEFVEYRYYYVMLKNKQIYSASDYGRLVKSNLVLPKDSLMYINFNNYNKFESHNRLVDYLFPFIDNVSIGGIVDSYLDKLGFYNRFFDIYPATGLKYYAAVKLFSDRLVIELTDIDTMATNTGLRKIVVDVLDNDMLTKKKINNEQIRKITVKLRKQKLFAGYKLDEAYKIIRSYYVDHNTSLAKDALAITDAYNRVFEPYRVVYDTKTRRQVLI